MASRTWPMRAGRLAIGRRRAVEATSPPNRYAAQTTLDAVAKNITVVVQNSGYRPATR